MLIAEIPLRAIASNGISGSRIRLNAAIGYDESECFKAIKATEVPIIAIGTTRQQVNSSVTEGFDKPCWRVKTLIPSCLSNRRKYVASVYLLSSV